MNAYDEVDAEEMFVLCSTVRHPKMFDRERRGPNEEHLAGHWEFDLRAETATSTLSMTTAEFPRVRRPRGPPVSLWLFGRARIRNRADALCRIDMRTGSVTRRTDNDEMGYGEPVFIR